MSQKFNDYLVPIEWKTLEEIREDVFKEIKDKRRKYGRNKN